MPADETIILAGGRGTRLQSVVSDVPKPLAPVAGRPFLAWILDRLAAGGMRRVIMATGYMADAIEDAVGDQWQSMAIAYSVETEPLGTGGAVRKACRALHGDSAHVLNGDTFLRYDAAAFAASVTRSGASLGVALAHVEDVSRYGAVERDGDRIVGFREKGGSGPGHVNAGCYFLTPKAIAALPGDGAFSLEDTVLAPMTVQGRVHGFDRTSGFIDIGVPGDYLRAQSLFSAIR